MPKPPSSLSPVRLLADGKTERDLLTSAIAAVESDGPLRVLEAGCGQRWPLEVEGRTLHITGVDTDAEAMRIRREKHADLDVEMVADLRAMELPVAAFDIVAEYGTFFLPRRLRWLRPVIHGAFALISRVAPGRRAVDHRDLGVIFGVPNIDAG